MEEIQMLNISLSIDRALLVARDHNGNPVFELHWYGWFTIKQVYINMFRQTFKNFNKKYTFSWSLS